MFLYLLFEIHSFSKLFMYQNLTIFLSFWDFLTRMSSFKYTSSSALIFVVRLHRSSFMSSIPKYKTGLLRNVLLQLSVHVRGECMAGIYKYLALYYLRIYGTYCNVTRFIEDDTRWYVWMRLFMTLLHTWYIYVLYMVLAYGCKSFFQIIHWDGCTCLWKYCIYYTCNTYWFIYRLSIRRIGWEAHSSTSPR